MGTPEVEQLPASTGAAHGNLLMNIHRRRSARRRNSMAARLQSERENKKARILSESGPL